MTTNLTVDYSVASDPRSPMGLRVIFTADSQVKIRNDVIEVTIDIDKNVKRLQPEDGPHYSRTKHRRNWPIRHFR